MSAVKKYKNIYTKDEHLSKSEKEVIKDYIEKIHLFLEEKPENSKKAADIISKLINSNK